MDIDIALNATWFPSQWQLPMLYPAREERAYFQLVSFLAPAGATEMQIYDLAPFTGSFAGSPRGRSLWPGGWPADLAEASGRLVYGILNAHAVDFPLFNWGDVGVVFNNSEVCLLCRALPRFYGDPYRVFWILKGSQSLISKP